MICHRCGYRGEFLILKEEGKPCCYVLTLKCPQCRTTFIEQVKHFTFPDYKTSSKSESAEGK